MKSMKLTRYGKKEWGLASIAALILWMAVLGIGLTLNAQGGMHLILHGSIVIFIFWLAFVAFFRDPSRTPPKDEDMLLSPADGLVKDIELIRAPDCKQLAEVFQGQDMLRIGIFLSVFDVHINRAPCPMQITFKEHKNGRYLDARDPRAGKENEALVIGGIGTAGGRSFPMAVRQISGAIARRIVCEAEVGTKLNRAEQYGMIKFGSRTELYIPAKAGLDIQVRIGDKVVCGMTKMVQVSAENKTE